MTADHAEQADTIREALNAHEYVIRSGGSYSETVLANTTDALAALHALVAALAAAEQRAKDAETALDRNLAAGVAEQTLRDQIREQRDQATARADALARRNKTLTELSTAVLSMYRTQMQGAERRGEPRLKWHVEYEMLAAALAGEEGADDA